MQTHRSLSLWTELLGSELTAVAFVRIDGQGNLVVEVQADAYADDPDAEVEANRQAVDASPLVQDFKDHCDARGILYAWTPSLADYVAWLTFETTGFDG